MSKMSELNIVRNEIINDLYDTGEYSVADISLIFNIALKEVTSVINEIVEH